MIIETPDGNKIEVPDSFTDEQIKNSIQRYNADVAAGAPSSDAAVVQELQSELLEAHADIVQYDIDMSEPNALQFTRVSEGLQRS